HDGADLVQPELKAGDDTEVTAAAPNRPEKVRVIIMIHVARLAVSGHDFSGQQVINRQDILADKQADPPAQRDAANPDRAGIAEAGCQTKSPDCRGVLTRRQS